MTELLRPDVKAEFEVLFAAFCEIQRSLLENTTKVAGFFLLAVGWLATSENARSYLSSDSLIRYSAICAVILIILTFCVVSWIALSASERIEMQLNSLEYVSAQSISHRRVTIQVLACYTLANVCLASLVVITLLRTANGA